MKLKEIKNIIKETLQKLKEQTSDWELDTIVLCGCSGGSVGQCVGSVDNSDPFAGETGDCSCCGNGMVVSMTLFQNTGRDIPVMNTGRDIPVRKQKKMFEEPTNPRLRDTRPLKHKQRALRPQGRNKRISPNKRGVNK
tara:strand:- start:2401 stop:2814 length:414 start_codon:yes stop_codon:yes gene_type:complete